MGKRLLTTIVVCSLACATSAAAGESRFSVQFTGGWSSVFVDETGGHLYHGGTVWGLGLGCALNEQLTAVVELDYGRLPFNKDNDVVWAHPSEFGNVPDGQPATLASAGVSLKIAPYRHKPIVAPYLLLGAGVSRLSFDLTVRSIETMVPLSISPTGTIETLQHAADTRTAVRPSIGIGIDVQVSRGVAMSVEGRIQEPFASGQQYGELYLQGKGYATVRLGIAFRL